MTGPPSAKNAIVVVNDIFGFSSQVLQGADILALEDDTNGPYRVFVPDFFEGKAADVSWYPPTTDEHNSNLATFFSGIGNPARTITRVPQIVNAIRESHKNVESIYGFGLCWGGKVRCADPYIWRKCLPVKWNVEVEMLIDERQVITMCSTANSPFKAAAQAHPAMIDPEDAKNITVPTLLLASKDENPSDVKAFVSNLKVTHQVETFGDQIHG